MFNFKAININEIQKNWERGNNQSSNLAEKLKTDAKKNLSLLDGWTYMDIFTLLFFLRIYLHFYVMEGMQASLNWNFSFETFYYFLVYCTFRKTCQIFIFN
jgi:hypothetical protein